MGRKQTPSDEDIFLSTIEEFPSAVAQAIGDLWPPEKVVAVVRRIRHNLGLPPLETKKSKPYGARDPNQVIE